MIGDRLSKYSDLGLLFFRVGFGLAFIYFHGWGKITGGPERWEGLGSSLSMFGIDFGHTFFGFMAAFAESVGALLFAVGLFYRPMALMLAFTMLVAWLSLQISGEGKPGHAFKNMVVLLGLLPLGPGKYSLDQFFANRRKDKN